MNPDSTIYIFTDGSSRDNPGPGGWGAIIAAQDKVIELGGREVHTTNNRMELTAVIEALSYLSQVSKVKDQKGIVFADSKYVVDGITKWVGGWQKNDWRTANKKAVLNRDLWEKLVAVARGRQISWRYVAGHTGQELNERADEIATDFADGAAPKLYSGVLKNYRIDIRGILSKNEITSLNKPTPFYISLVGGILKRHATWSECEAHVKGKAGAKFKKVRSQNEADKILKEWKAPKGNS